MQQISAPTSIHWELSSSRHSQAIPLILEAQLQTTLGSTKPKIYLQYAAYTQVCLMNWMLSCKRQWLNSLMLVTRHHASLLLLSSTYNSVSADLCLLYPRHSLSL